MPGMEWFEKQAAMFKEQQEAAGTEPKKAYAASLECIEALISDMTTGNLAPPKVKAPATATAPAAKGKAKAAAPAAPPPADGGKKDKKSEADNANNPEGRQGVKKEKVKKAAPPKAEGAAAGERDIDVSWADIRVGKILEASKHPDSPKLYVEVIDLGRAAAGAERPRGAHAARPGGGRDGDLHLQPPGEEDGRSGVAGDGALRQRQGQDCPLLRRASGGLGAGRQGDVGRLPG